MSNLTGDQKQKLFNVCVAFVLGVFAVFGLIQNTNNQAPAPSAPIVVGSQSLSEQKFSAIRVDGTSILNGDVTAGRGVSVGGNFTVTGAIATTGGSSASAYSAVNLTSTGKSLLNSLDVNSAIVLTGSLTAAGDVQARQITATAQISTAKLTIGAVTTLNALTFGTAVGSSAADGGTIAHSMGVTPTICLLSGSGDNTLTRTLRVGALSATNITLAASPGVTGTVQWACYR